jgi:hypothetical protein
LEDRIRACCPVSIRRIPSIERGFMRAEVIREMRDRNMHEGIEIWADLFSIRLNEGEARALVEWLRRALKCF